MTRILIHGLRRSGTTILWETLRSDPALRCYDEPFHPLFAAGTRQNHKGTWTELSADVDTLGVPPAPIHPLEELEPGSTPDQADWLAALFAAHDNVAIDLVRCWNRMPTLAAASDNVTHIHILRDPANWASAHLLPSGLQTFRRRIADIYRRGAFFSRRGFYDGYQYQRIIEAALERDHPVFRFVGVTAKDLAQMPAYMRLLAFWWGANATLAQSLASTGLPYMAVTLAEFSADPAREIGRISKLAGWHGPQVDTAKVRRVTDSLGAASPRWRAAAQCLGIPEDIVGAGGRRADRLTEALLGARAT